MVLEKALKYYFSENDNESASPWALWAAHKAGMRGRLIQLASQIKCEHGAKIKKLTEEFCMLSISHKSNPTPDNLTRLDSARVQLNLSLTTSAEKHLQWTGVCFYYQKAKLIKLTRITGNLIQNPVKIMDFFHSFYSSLYNNQPHTHP